LRERAWQAGVDSDGMVLRDGCRSGDRWPVNKNIVTALTRTMPTAEARRRIGRERIRSINDSVRSI
jgi:hypothetical protein